jgi:ribosomal protein S18 acetylase RimI-like enzyme
LYKTKDEREYGIGLLYIIPELRSKGLGEQLIQLLESYAKENLKANKLSLVVRIYNPRAQKCYIKCGFKEVGREDTLISMVKEI